MSSIDKRFIAFCLVLVMFAGGQIATATGLSPRRVSHLHLQRSVSGAANRGSAEVEAARLLGLVQLPGGTVSSPSEPAGDQHALAQPSYNEATPNLVDAHAWWTTSATADEVLAFVAAHLPAGARRYTSSQGGAGGVTFATETFSLPAIAGVLGERVLGVAVAALADGTTAVRTDGVAVWLTPRPSWEQIPTGIRSVTFTASGQRDDGRVGPISTPRTLTGDRARKLASVINLAPVVQPGSRSCPLALTESVTLRFIGAAGRPVARAVEQPSGCASVALTIGRRVGPPLNDFPSVTDELVRLHAVPVCAGAQLAGTVSLPGRNGPANARAVAFRFQNRSRVMCRLSGFPRLVLFDAGGRRLSITLHNQGASSVRREGPAATSVLDPDQSAGFFATYTSCRGATVAMRAHVALPGVARRFSLAVGSPRKTFAPCRGTVGVGNIQRT